MSDRLRLIRANRKSDLASERWLAAAFFLVAICAAFAANTALRHVPYKQPGPPVYLYVRIRHDKPI